MMPKITHLTYDMRIGGTEQVIVNLIKSIDNTRFEQSILCIEAPLGPFGDMLKAENIIIDVLERTPGFDFNLVKKIREYVLKNEIDILHCHQYTPWSYGVLACIGTKVKVIFTEHGRFHPDQSSKKRQFINPILMLFTSAITAISKATKKALVDYEFIKESKIQVIYNGIQPLEITEDKLKIAKQLKTSYGMSDDAIVFGTISRFDPIKNHRLMIDAFAAFQQKYESSYLIIVGDGEMRPEIEQQIIKLELSNNVKLTGYQTQPETFLVLMDIFLLTSFSEGTSMTLLEALSIGKPCIVTNVGGNPEVIIDSENGIVIENDNLSQCIHAMHTIVESDTDYNCVNRTRYDTYFSATNMARKFTNLYEDLL